MLYTIYVELQKNTLDSFVKKSFIRKLKKYRNLLKSPMKLLNFKANFCIIHSSFFAVACSLFVVSFVVATLQRRVICFKSFYFVNKQLKTAVFQHRIWEEKINKYVYLSQCHSHWDCYFFSSLAMMMSKIIVSLHNFSFCQVKLIPNVHLS